MSKILKMTKQFYYSGKMELGVSIGGGKDGSDYITIKHYSEDSGRHRDLWMNEADFLELVEVIQEYMEDRESERKGNE